MPQGVSRLGPRRTTARLEKESWAFNLAGRVGWHGVKTVERDAMMFYLAVERGMDYTPTPVALSRAICWHPACMIKCNMRASDTKQR